MPLLALTQGALPLFVILAKGHLPLLLKQQMWKRCILLLQGNPRYNHSTRRGGLSSP